MATRREFVRGCLVAAAGTAAAGALYGLGSAVLPAPAPPPERVDYLGAALLAGPAVRGVPLLPLATRSDGSIEADPAPRSVPGGVLRWYRYCAHDDIAPLQPGFQPRDELVRYFATPDKVESARMAGDAWWEGRLGQVANVADFAPGKGAPAAWRSAGMQGKSIVTASLVRPEASIAYEDDDVRRVVESDFAARAPDGGLVLGFVAFCPHFCCIVGWHDSVIAQRRGSWDTLYCGCHDVVCDAARVRRDFFVRNPPPLSART